MITHNGIKYNWEQVYKICGLAAEDFTHGHVGSWEHFIKCLEKWEDGK